MLKKIKSVHAVEFAVELQAVWASYSEDYTLKNLTLAIPEGIIQFIIGQNGAGKTTLIKVLNGLVKPQKGSVIILGKKREAYNSLADLRTNLGYIPQNLGLVKMMTARENVLMGCLPRINALHSFFKIFPKKEQEFANYLLATVGLTTKADAKVHCLSGGEKRRVAIARALMQKPKILLADEILSDLDFKIAQDIMEKLRKLKEEFKITLIMVEHDIVTVKKFGDKIALIKNGEIKLNTTVNNLNDNIIYKLFSGDA
ncbi:ATP-binding cassette domain-containing protein [Candidatus Woesearchaeota archaeon]|nr:ATP-binding cassette domain-containing protein [Candidatus Woesearchaeota archaeon]